MRPLTKNKGLLFFGEKEAGHVQDLCSTQKKGKEKEEISRVINSQD